MDSDDEDRLEKRPSKTFSASETLEFLTHFDKAVEAWIWGKRFRGKTSLFDVAGEEVDAAAATAVAAVAAVAADDEGADLAAVAAAAVFAFGSEVNAVIVANECEVGTGAVQ